MTTFPCRSSILLRYETGSIERYTADRLSRRRMIWFLPHPLPPLACQQFVSLSQSSCLSPVKRRGGGQIIRLGESLVLINNLILSDMTKQIDETRQFAENLCRPIYCLISFVYDTTRLFCISKKKFVFVV